jgi:hypothetical protein
MEIDKNEFKGKKILVHATGMPKEELCFLAKNSSSYIEFMLENNDRSQYPSFFSGDLIDRQYHYPTQVIKGNNNKTVKKNGLNAIFFWEKIINDHQTFFLYDRTNFPFASTEKKSAEILENIITVLHFLEEKKPFAIFFDCTPHIYDVWIFARVAELMGIKILYTQDSIFPWRYFLLSGLQKMPNLVKIMGTKISNEITIERDYIKSKLKKMTDASPLYIQLRIKKNKGKIYNIFSDLKRWWKRPDLILNKYLCFKRYKALSTKNLPEKFIILFLHYEPERTTLPEGFGFTQQLAAIKALELALPNGVKLLVKEHPSTFERLCHWKVRTPGWYNKIISNKIELVDINIDPYTLIDKSVATTSITGTVAGETLFRGKPTIIFGAGSSYYTECEKLHKYTTIENLSLFLQNSLKSTNPFDLKESIMNYTVDRTWSSLTSEVTFEEWRKRDPEIFHARAAVAFLTEILV